MFDAVVSYFIVFELECSKCLCEKMKLKVSICKKKEVYCLMSESICKILSAFISDLITRKVDANECLNKKMEFGMRKMKIGRLTSLLVIALARYCTPLSPILLQLRSNVVNVYVQKWRYKLEKRRRRMGFTLLFRKASARYWAPWWPMEFFEISSVVSIYTRKWICKRGKWKKSQLYRIFSYDIGETVSSFVPNLVVVKWKFLLCL